MRRIPTAVLVLVLTSCGGGDQALWKSIGERCANPRVGTDPFTGNSYPDQKGTLDDERKFLKAWIDDTYLWYSEVPASDPAQYATATDYFNVLKTTQKTASGNDKDRFHFFQNTADWEQLSQSGVQAGYGVTWALLATKPPRKAVVAYNEPGSPAAAQGVTRGLEVTQVDGVNVVDGPAAPLNAGLFPATVNEQHTFTLQDPSGATRTVTMTSANVTSSPVQNTHVIDLGTGGRVGYILFNDHLATAEKALIAAVNQLKAAPGINDLVLDLRYNGGGYLAIASQLAYMIAGSANTSGKVFERTIFNDKHASVDPVADQLISPTPFYSITIGLSVAAGSSLPTLNLSRVFVLTGSGTCSASESILNGLSGAGVQVFQIGSTTCGKPYGFYPQDNCGTTYFSIQFKGINAKGFGDYADGFVPGSTAAGMFAGCPMGDDFTHQLGDTNEALLATALAYRTSSTCPAPTSRSLVFGGLSGEARVFKSIWQTNRILRR